MNIDKILIYKRRSLSGVNDNVLNCDTIGIGFELQSRYYVHFRTNAPWKILTLNRIFNARVAYSCFTALLPLACVIYILSNSFSAVVRIFHNIRKF